MAKIFIYLDDNNHVLDYENEIPGRVIKETEKIKAVEKVPKGFEKNYYQYSFVNGKLKRDKNRLHPNLEENQLEEEKLEILNWFATVSDIQTNKYIQGTFKGNEEDWEALVKQAEEKRNRINEINQVLKDKYNEEAE